MDPELQRQIDQVLAQLYGQDPSSFGDLSNVSSAPNVGIEAPIVGDSPGAFEAEKSMRFSRNKLDAPSQKIFDQLKQQRADLEQSMGAEKAKQLYTTMENLTPDETLALMAQELASTGVTDIYKVKPVTNKLPVYQEDRFDGETAGRYTAFIGPDGSNITTDNPELRFDEQGNPYLERQGYINTETGQPLATNRSLTPFEYRGDILSDYSVGERRDVGTGVTFTPEGVPVYFAEGIATPSRWVKFRENVVEPVTAGIAGYYGGPAAAAAVRGAQVYHDTGDLSDALKAAAISGATAYGISQLGGTADVGTPSALDAGMGTADVGTPSALNAGMDLYDVSNFTPYAPGEAGIQQILQEAGVNVASELPPIEVTPLSGELPVDVGADELLATALSGEAPVVSEPFDITDVVPATESLPQFSPEDMVPPSALSGFEPAPPSLPTVPPAAPEWETGYPTEPEVPQGSLASEVGPPVPSTGEKVFADLKDFAASPLGKLAMTLGGSALVNKIFEEQKSGSAGPQGWSGTIPKYQAVRERVPFTDTARRPGEYGRRYFSDTTYVPMQTGEGAAEKNLASIAAAKEAAQRQAAGLASIPTRPVVKPPALKYMDTDPSLPPRATPAVGLPSLPTYANEPRLSFGLPTETVEETFTPERRRAMSMQNALAARGTGLAAGGIAQGRYLNGTTDGMEDKVPAHIDGKQPARLSHGEFVIPADVVSHLGNGNSQSGAKRLYDMMDRIRKARTGTTKQGKQIQPDKYLPV